MPVNESIFEGTTIKCFGETGDPKRIARVTADMLAHFEKRVEAVGGKAMVTTTRVGLSVAEKLPLRFYLEGSRFKTVRCAPG